MKRTGVAVTLFAVLALVGLVVAGALASTAVRSPGEIGDSGQTTTGIDTTTTTAGTTTEPALLPSGVTIGGVEVGGLAPAEATAAIQQSFARPIVLRYGRTTVTIAPTLLGARLSVKRALTLASDAPPNSAVPLPIKIDRRRTSAFLGKVLQRFEREPVDARLFLRHLVPVVTRSRPGKQFRLKPIVTAIAAELAENVRARIVLEPKLIEPKVSSASFAAIIVVRRRSDHLYFYRGMKLLRVFGVATGRSRYPTPLGRFRIVVKWKNPWWYPPAKGAKPVPPGPDNPLGTRWMGISSPGVGIHGAPSAASIAYSAAHGCIRMRVVDAKWLFGRVHVGTPVFVVSA